MCLSSDNDAFPVKDKEQVYDDLISPLVQQILAICQEHKIPMFTSFQFSSDGFCTSALEQGGHPVFRHYRVLSQCITPGGVNIDSYMFWTAKMARVEGHSSIWLHQAGIPTNPCDQPKN